MKLKVATDAVREHVAVQRDQRRERATARGRVEIDTHTEVAEIGDRGDRTYLRLHEHPFQDHSLPSQQVFDGIRRFSHTQNVTH